MYFNDEKNSTNIDDEFNEKPKFNLDFNGLLSNKKILIGIGVGLLLIIFLIILLTSNKKEYYLNLLGSEDLIVYQNTDYVDEGYEAYDNKGNKYNEQVIVEGQVNTNIVGEYIITYSFNNIVKTRTVSVVSETKHLTYLILNGETIIYLKVGDKFTDPGYTVLDSTNDNLQSRVKTVGEVDTTKVGTYKIIYSVKNDLGLTVTAERTVIIMDTDINIYYNKDTYSNDSVIINIGVMNNYFDYILLPNGNKDTRRTTTYKVTKNGTYKFAVYSKDGSFKEESVTINNIDKDKPTGSCTAKYTNGSYIINTNITDGLSGIKSFEYYLDNTLKESTNKASVSIKATSNTTNKYVKSNNISLIVYDNANNSNKITCTVDNSAFEEPKPSSSQTPTYTPSSSSKSSSSSRFSSSSKSSSSSKQSTSTGGSGSGICPHSGSRMTAYLNGRQLTYDEVITMSVGQTISITLYLPSNCGTPSSYYLTRTTADGQSGWRDYLSGSSSPSVPHNSGKSVKTNTYNWIIKANKKTPGGIILSQTSEFRSDQYSFSKHFYRIVVKVQ